MIMGWSVFTYLSHMMEHDAVLRIVYIRNDSGYYLSFLLIVMLMGKKKTNHVYASLREVNIKKA